MRIVRTFRPDCLAAVTSSFVYRVMARFTENDTVGNHVGTTLLNMTKVMGMCAFAILMAFFSSLVEANYLFATTGTFKFLPYKCLLFCCTWKLLLSTHLSSPQILHRTTLMIRHNTFFWLGFRSWLLVLYEVDSPVICSRANQRSPVNSRDP